MKILVTGANGYIGRFVVRILLDMGHDVLAADLRYDEVDKRAVRLDVPIFSGDKNIYSITDEPDICIHLAWRDGFILNADSHLNDFSKHYVFLSNMVYGGLRHLSVMGTMHEIGYWEGAVDENTPTNPVTKYGIAKNCLRSALFNVCQDKNETVFQWLRAFYITGDDRRNNSIFRKLIDAEAAGHKTFPFTLGKNLYDFIDVEELALQIATASEQTEVKGIINCCSGNPVSLADKVTSFINENNLKITLEYGAFPDRPHDSPGIWGDNKIIAEIMKKNRTI